VKNLSYRADFGVLVRNYRENKRYSREALAELCGISDRCISNIERGISNPKLDTVVNLCSVCGIDIGLLNFLKDDDVHSDDSVFLTR
jgi:transcriptional regulator with XRE-family HTH domain